MYYVYINNEILDLILVLFFTYYLVNFRKFVFVFIEFRLMDIVCNFMENKFKNRIVNSVMVIPLTFLVGTIFTIMDNLYFFK